VCPQAAQHLAAWAAALQRRRRCRWRHSTRRWCNPPASPATSPPSAASPCRCEFTILHVLLSQLHSPAAPQLTLTGGGLPPYNPGQTLPGWWAGLAMESVLHGFSRIAPYPGQVQRVPECGSHHWQPSCHWRSRSGRHVRGSHCCRHPGTRGWQAAEPRQPAGTCPTSTCKSFSGVRMHSKRLSAYTAAMSPG
jgi:hypothetical protein